MKKIFLSLSLFTLLFLNACMHITSSSAGNSSVNALKTGESCLTGFLFFAPFINEDVSTQTAMENGKITQVHSTEVVFKNYFFFSKNCIVVRGN